MLYSGIKILFVDDDTNILASYKRQLHDKFEVFTATGGDVGLQGLRDDGPYAVVVSDLKMPSMDGITFLSKAKEISPDTSRILLTGYADVNNAIDAVNNGNIFRFLTKPCEGPQLIAALEDAVKQYQLVTAEKELLEKTLQGSIKVLVELLALLDPLSFSRATRIRKMMQDMSKQLRVTNAWQFEIAAMLASIGCVTIPNGILEKAYRSMNLFPNEKVVFDNHPAIGSELLKKIPRMEKVAEIIKYQEKHFDGAGVPKGLVSGDMIPLGSRMIKILHDYDALTTGGILPVEAVKKMKMRVGWYDPELLDILEGQLSKQKKYIGKTVTFDELIPGMLVADDIMTVIGEPVVGKGQEVTSSLIIKLKNIKLNTELVEPFKVLILGD